MKENIVLVCTSVWYYSITDEDLFFEWIKRIHSIKHIGGVGDKLTLSFENSNIADEDLRELIGLFYRYKIDMKQLKVFLNNANKEWFYEKPRGYWFRRVFGSKN